VLLGLAGAAVSLAASRHFPPVLFTEAAENVWFSADQRRYLTNAVVSWREGWHARTSVHPAFSILFYVPVALLAAAGLGAYWAATLLVSAAAGGTVAFFHRALLCLGLARLEAAAFALLLIASAGFIFWSGVIETYVFGMLSVAFGFWVIAQPTASMLLWSAASAATLAITTTNWSLALAGALFTLGRWRAVRAAVAGLSIVLALAVAQAALFPTARLFFDVRELMKERHYTQFSISDPAAKVWTPGANLRVLAVYAAVTPQPVVEEVREGRDPYRIVTNQTVPPSAFGWPGAAAAGLWIALLSAGVWGMATGLRRSVALALGAFVLGQFALHSVYGSVTMLYAGNFLLPLVAVAAMSSLTPWRRSAAVAAMACAGLAAVNNWSAFVAAAAAAVAVAEGLGR
jgi:hypothetical protein